jgi:hypothetical protein
MAGPVPASHAAPASARMTGHDGGPASQDYLPQAWCCGSREYRAIAE